MLTIKHRGGSTERERSRWIKGGGDVPVGDDGGAIILFGGGRRLVTIGS